MHTCNPWCFGGLHAILVDNLGADRAQAMPVAQAMAQRAGLVYAGASEVRAPGAPLPGTPTPQGVARSRVVVWAREPRGRR
jgi:hypothetical protein